MGAPMGHRNPSEGTEEEAGLERGSRSGGQAATEGTPFVPPAVRVCLLRYMCDIDVQYMYNMYNMYCAGCR